MPRWLPPTSDATLLPASLPLRQPAIELKPPFPVNAVRLLRAGTPREIPLGDDGTVRRTIPELNSYEIVLFDR